jgi:hypothetical protein
MSTHPTDEIAEVAKAEEEAGVVDQQAIASAAVAQARADSPRMECPRPIQPRGRTMCLHRPRDPQANRSSIHNLTMGRVTKRCCAASRTVPPGSEKTYPVRIMR